MPREEMLRRMSSAELTGWSVYLRVKYTKDGATAFEDDPNAAAASAMGLMAEIAQRR